MSRTPASQRLVVAGTPASSPAIAALGLRSELGARRRRGLRHLDDQAGLKTRNHVRARAIVIAANTDIGVLYGVFALSPAAPDASADRRSCTSSRRRACATASSITGTTSTAAVERGYAGASLWDWHTLPDDTPPRYTDYARANASLGINGTVLNNVNANATSLTPEYIAKAAALADVFRPYGIRVYLSARFSAPIEIGGLKTADPLAPEVKAWWARKADEIYAAIPDFGGFLVKANSEGQPGPQDYDRTHADGANMLADALAPHGGLVMWRAFVYAENSDDRAKQAYTEFTPLDGRFRRNVLLQIKNGPIDFQPREPFSPLFGAMPQTPLTIELQITKEYLGLRDTPRLPGAALRGGAGGRHARERQRARRARRAAGRRRRRQHRHQPHLVRRGVRVRQLARVRAARVEPASHVRGARRRVAAHDVHQRSGVRRAGQGDDARLASGRGGLHDAARARTT